MKNQIQEDSEGWKLTSPERWRAQSLLRVELEANVRMTREMAIHEARLKMLMEMLGFKTVAQARAELLPLVPLTITKKPRQARGINRELALAAATAAAKTMAQLFEEAAQQIAPKRVSRISFRQAVGALCREGKLRKHPAKGDGFKYSKVEGAN